MIIQKTILNEDEAAEFLGVQPQTLAIWRCKKRYALPYIRVGRLIRYQIEDLQNWLESRRITDDSLVSA